MAETPFGFDKPHDSPGFLLWQTMITWQRLIKKVLEPHEISHAQFVLMALLLWFDLNQQDTSQAQLVSWSKLDKMTVSKALRQLEEMDYLSREADSADARAKRITLTLRGKMVVLKIVPLVEQADARFFETIPTHDQQTLIQILRQLPLLDTDN